MIASGGLSGGLSSAIAGGNFWSGVREGLITSGLNAISNILINDNPQEGNEKKGKVGYASVRKKISKSNNGEVISFLPDSDDFHSVFDNVVPEAGILKIIIHGNPDIISDNMDLTLNPSEAHEIFQEISLLYQQSVNIGQQITVMLIACNTGYEYPNSFNFASRLSVLNGNAKVAGFNDYVNKHGPRKGANINIYQYGSKIFDVDMISRFTGFTYKNPVTGRLYDKFRY
jgi:hypothetical protein